MGLQDIANAGRYGDNSLVHIHPSELRGLQALTGMPVTINPETGLPEMFSWKKLLGAVALGIAAIPTGGMSLLGGLGIASGIGAGAATGLGLLGASKLLGSAMADKGKSSTDARGSEATEALKRRQQEKMRDMYKFATPTFVNSSAQPSLLGYEQNYFQQPYAVPPMQQGIPPMYNDSPARFASGGQLEPEEQQAKEIVVQYLAALRGQHGNPAAAESRFIEYYGPKAAQDLRRGGMVSGPGGGMDDMVAASVDGQKALLSNDEFVVPADVVSALGDGSSSSGARKLHAMMDRVRKEKTGSREQPGKISNAVMPR